MIRKMLILCIIIITVTGIFLLINIKPQQQNDIHKEIPGFSKLLVGKEFSGINYYNGAIYAGGIEGLFVIDPETFEFNELMDNNKAYEAIRVIYKDKNNLWIGHDAGISIIGEGNSRSITKIDGLKDTRIIDILRVNDSTVYAATFSGVAVIKDENISFITKNDYLPGEAIKVMMKDGYGGIWLGAYTSRDGGLVIESNGNKQFFDISSGLVHNCITSIIETSDRKVYVGGGLYTEGGANIFQYEENKWVIIKTIKKVDGLAGEKVRNIFIDNEKNVWICSEYDGVAIFKENGDILVITEKDGLSNNEVKKIVQDKNNNYWLATKTGVTFINQKIFMKEGVKE